MAGTAFQTQYRQEFIAGFEQTESLVRKPVTTETVIKGNQATFLVADSGGAEAQTRGVNGRTLLLPFAAQAIQPAVKVTAELIFAFCSNNARWHER